jgi:hypothetical protein
MSCGAGSLHCKSRTRCSSPLAAPCIQIGDSARGVDRSIRNPIAGPDSDSVCVHLTERRLLVPRDLSFRNDGLSIRLRPTVGRRRRLAGRSMPPRSGRQNTRLPRGARAPARHRERSPVHSAISSIAKGPGPIGRRISASSMVSMVSMNRGSRMLADSGARCLVNVQPETVGKPRRPGQRLRERAARTSQACRTHRRQGRQLATCHLPVDRLRDIDGMDG